LTYRSRGMVHQDTTTGSMLYTYPPLESGTLVNRYKRFFADIQLDSGELITAHCPNTGPMIGVCEIGASVKVSRSNDPKRKLAYTWELIHADDTWVGINTNLPNKIIKLALEQHLFPELGKYQEIQTEVKYGRGGKSRIDFVLTGADRPIYLEVKNATLVEGDTALFPDTITTRGQKHLEDLMSIMPASTAVMLYLINRGDVKKFAPCDSRDKVYGELFRSAVAKGMKVLPCCFDISPEGVEFVGMAELLLHQPAED
jgi:sugar fermentation stimulation protein A